MATRESGIFTDIATLHGRESMIAEAVKRFVRMYEVDASVSSLSELKIAIIAAREQCGVRQTKLRARAK